MISPQNLISSNFRYMDICMGLSLLVSLVSLEYGSMSGERGPLALFLILRWTFSWHLYEDVKIWGYDGDALFLMLRMFSHQHLYEDMMDAWVVCPSPQFWVETFIFWIILDPTHMLTYHCWPPSLATIAGYWLWFLYLKYLKMESEASKEVTSFKMLMRRMKALVESCNSVKSKWHFESRNIGIDFTLRF